MRRIHRSGRLIDVLNTVTSLGDRGVNVRSIADGIDGIDDSDGSTPT